MHTLVLLRHGESQSNQDNLFTEWSDVDLTEKGAKEAKNSGILLKKYNYQFDKIFSSVLKRAVKTMDLCLNEMEQNHIPIVYDWRLNEQHYGDLVGLNKSEKNVLIDLSSWISSYIAVPFLSLFILVSRSDLYILEIFSLIFKSVYSSPSIDLTSDCS